MDPAINPSPELPLYADPLAVRLVALALLQQVTDRRRFLDEALEDSAEFKALPPKDRAFTRMLVTTALRRLGQIDDLINRAMDGKGPARPETLQAILRLGMCEMIAMDTPDHAAVDCAVDLAVAAGQARAKGLVNAVLRRMGREGREWTTRQDIPRLCIPEWLFGRWVRDYGLARATDIAVATLKEAPLDMTIKHTERVSHWAQALEAQVLPTGTVRRVIHGNVTQLPGFTDGEWWVQDAASALPVQCLGDINGRLVADLCAAPGGKTAQMLAAGADVVCVERSAKRLKILEANIERLGLKPPRECVVADVLSFNPRELFDAVLLDAPCTATGTLRRHPDGFYLKREADIAAMATVQGDLIRHALTFLKPGGVLVYAVCSLQKEEGEHLLNRIIENADDIRRLPITAGELGLSPEMVSVEGYVRLLPCQWPSFGGIDGFFIARLMKL